MRIMFDMDGTIVDFYNYNNWLKYLMANQTVPYERAKPLFNMNSFARVLNRLQKEGHEIGIISWGSKGASYEYLEQIVIAKKKWLKKHLGSVVWDYVHIIDYGTPKELFAKGNDILFDDEENNRVMWQNAGLTAYNEKNILGVLKKL